MVLLSVTYLVIQRIYGCMSVYCLLYQIYFENYSDCYVYSLHYARTAGDRLQFSSMMKLEIGLTQMT